MMRFSEDFIKDLANIIDSCIENKTDNCKVNFEFNGKKLEISISFALKEVE